MDCGVVECLEGKEGWGGGLWGIGFVFYSWFDGLLGLKMLRDFLGLFLVRLFFFWN